MLLVLSAVFAFLAIVVYALKGQGAFLKAIALMALGCVGILSAIEVGLSLITGEGVNDAVFYHMKTGLGGGDISQYALPVAGALVGLAVMVWLAVRFHGKLSGALQRSYLWNAVVVCLAMSSIAVHPVTTSTASYLLRFQGAEQYQAGFHTPADEVLLSVNETPKNLVLLYLESVERTYFDQDRFPDLVPNLKALEAQSLSFTDMTQTMGAGFTIGGMVASQCGMPLILSGGANSMRVNQFLSGADCLGDILSDAGYQTAYLGGASIEFAGKGAFYKTHGYDSVEGLDELKPDLQDPDYLAEWGLQDDTLFDLARRKIEGLAQQEAPFALTMLTLDTHHPNGHAETNKQCRDTPYLDGSNPMLNSVKCVDQLAGEFINDILNGPEGENTLIVVMSDHLAMGNTATKDLEAGARRNLLFIVDPSAEGEMQIDRPSTTLDVAPTVLSKLGFDVPRLGFGVDLLSAEPTLPEEMGVTADEKSVLDRYLLGFQSVYDKLWAYPDISDGLYTNLEKREVQFGANAFGTPVLLTFDETYAVSSATLGDTRAEETLTEAVLDLPTDTRLMWIDDCRALELLSTDRVKLKSSETCIAHGLRGTGLSVSPVSRSDFTPSEALQAYLDAQGDSYLAPFEESKLEEIGILRGELPFRLKHADINNDGRGVLIQSAGFGAGASFIRRQTSDSLAAGEDWILKRGITLAGLDVSGRVEVLANVDQCAKAFSPAENPNWLSLIKESLDLYSAHIISVHDTAFCGDGTPIFSGPLAGLELPKLQASKMRQAYVGVIDHNGRAYEFLNQTFPKLRVLLDPQTGELPDFTRVDFNTDLKAPAVAMQKQPTAVAPLRETSTQTGPCRVVPVQVPSQPITTLEMNKVLRGTELTSVIGFSEGWWPIEKAGRWSGSTDSQFEILLPDIDGALEVAFDVVSYGADRRTMSLWHNDRALGSQSFKGSSQITFDVTNLPREQVVTLRVETDNADVSCPQRNGTGTDPRALNFMLKSAELRAGKTTAPAVETPKLVSASINGTCTAPLSFGFEDTAQSRLVSGANNMLSDAEVAGQIAFGSGWWGRETFGRWIGADYAELELILPEGSDQLDLELQTIAYAKSSVDLEVVFDQSVIHSSRAGIGQPLRFDVSNLPRAIPIRLGFRLDGADPRCPAIDGASADTRFLRLMVQSIRLNTASTTLFGGAVAHAGGRLNGEALTNSFDALQANSDKFETFEIDFSWTTDGDIVCIHDWDESLTNRFDESEGPMSRADFTKALSNTLDRPRNCDLDGLAGWMRANPGKRIVTDIKSNPLEGHELIAARHPDILAQFIPQAYQPDEIAALKSLGFKDVVWTLYRFPRDQERIIQEAMAHLPAAITMPFEWALDGDLQAVRGQTGLPIMVHTINDPAVAVCLRELGAAAIYTDDLGVESIAALKDQACSQGA